MQAPAMPSAITSGPEIFAMNPAMALGVATHIASIFII
jgi:hypothetical protein